MKVRWLKRLFGVAGILLVSYLIAVGIFYWNWMIPHKKFPEGHQQYGEQVLINPEYKDLGVSVDKLIKEKTKSLSVPSLSASFAINNELVWSGTSGLANIEQRIPAMISSQYRSGSVSKSLTSLVVARLLDQGKFKVGTNTSLPFEDNYFDILLSVSTIHYEQSKSNLIRALEEFRRVLKPVRESFI